jgi:hypothetical protein
MDIQTILKDCLKEICTDFPSVAHVVHAHYPADIDFQQEVDYFKSVLQPLFIQIVQKDDSIFSEPRYFLRGVDFSQLMNTDNEKSKEKLWTYARLLLACSYLGVDIMDTIKQLWSKFTGKTDTDEIDEVLKEEKTQTGVQELLETLKETRIFKLGMEVMENLNIEKLGLNEIDFSNIENLVEMVKNPEHPVTKKAIQSVQGLIEDKMKRGSLRREDFIAEIEMLKEKFKHSLGKLFKTELFGDTTTREVQPAQVLMSNHPDARRARMLARLQRKLGK